jgi:hypothetical protein
VHLGLVTKLNKSISFLEYIAKNIGIRRARGKFVLSTNPDDLLPSSFFDLIAAHQFNSGIFYRAVRWDNRVNTSQTIPELARGLNEQWTIQNWNVNQRCMIRRDRFKLIDSQKAYESDSFPCGGGDFLLLSKKMWDAVEGFNEFPANPNVDAIFTARLMKFVPGYAQLVVHPLILHQRHVKRNVFRPAVDNHTDYMNEYCCWGVCKICGKFADTVDWGLSASQFEDVVS